MTFEERLAELRTTMSDELARARREALVDFLDIAARVRGASTEAEQKDVFEESARQFGADSAAVEFLKTLAPWPVPGDEMHLRAARFARVRVAEIQLYHATAVNSGRAARDVYTAVKLQMDAAREAYRARFLTPANGCADYLHAEFVRSLANDDASLLGKTYPGPLV
jgi:hypothetical protein